MEPQYVWDAASSRYRDTATGRYVTPQTVHGWLVETTANAGRSARDLTQALRVGDIPLKQWQLEMTTQIRMAHSASAAAAKGGLAQMTTADWTRVEGHIARELGFLDNFARGIADGSIPLDGKTLGRAEQYMRAGRGTYADFQRREQRSSGKTRERRVLGGTEHCDDCVEYASRGWQPIGSLPVPGEASQCRANCQCSLEFE